MKRSGLTTMAIGISLLLAGCHSLTKQVYSVSVTPSCGTVTQMGQTFQYEATATVGDRNGSAPEDITDTATWSSSTPTVVTIAAGKGQAVGCGTATITATYGGRMGQSQFTSECTKVPTTGVTLQSITIYPTNPTIAEVGQTTQFAAVGTYSDSTTADLSHSVVWASTSTPIAIISSTGLATATACGRTTITAQDGSIVGQVILTVSCSVPQVVQLFVRKNGGTTPAAIVSSPAGIDCGTMCETLFDSGTGVTLTATPPPPSGWSGCDQVLSNGSVCSLTVYPDPPDPTCPTAYCKTVTANY